MKKIDGRKLSKETLEQERRIAIKALKNGKTQTEVADMLQLARSTINTWWNKYKKEGVKALKNKKKGTHKRRELKPWQAAVIVHLIQTHTPQQLGLSYYLWNRAAVVELIKLKFGISRSARTIGRYLKAWDFSLQKPFKRAYEQDPEAVKRWKEKDFPRIKEEAESEGADIYWLDEMGASSAENGERSYGKQGRTPVVLTPGRKYKCNVLSTIRANGELDFMLLEREVNKHVFISFLEKWLSEKDKKIYLIVDSHPAHTAQEVKNWVAKHKDKIRLFFLPSYSPELNPVELLNQDVKTNAVKKKGHRWLKDLVENLYSYLIARPIEVVKNYFLHHLVNYIVC